MIPKASPPSSTSVTVTTRKKKFLGHMSYSVFFVFLGGEQKNHSEEGEITAAGYFPAKSETRS